MNLLIILGIISVVLIALLVLLIFFTTSKNSQKNSEINNEETPVTEDSTQPENPKQENQQEISETDETKDLEENKDNESHKEPIKIKKENVHKKKKKAFKISFIRFFETITGIRSRKVKKNYKKSLEKINCGDFQIAKNLLTEALKGDSKKKETYLKLANIALLEKNENLAMNYYLKLLDSHPEYLDVMLALEKIYLIRNMNIAAMNIMEKLHEKFPQNAEVQIDYLKCRTNVVNYDDERETTALFEELRKMPHQDKNLLYNYSMASYYARMGDVDSAYEYCRKALRISPADFESNKLCGLISIIKHDYESAKKYLGKALKCNNKNDEVHNLISYIVCQSKSRDELRKNRERYFEFIRKN